MWCPIECLWVDTGAPVHHGRVAPQTAPPDGTPVPVMLSQGQAARWCGVSPTTIRRAREEGRLPNAVQSASGGWRIPVPDLLAAGFKVQGAPAPRHREGAPQTAPSSAPPAQGSAPLVSPEIEELRRELAETRQRAQLAETKAAIAEVEKRAAERLVAARTEQVEDLRSALRILEVGHTTPDALAQQSAATPGTEAFAASEESPLDSPPPDTGTTSVGSGRRRWWQRGR